MRKFLFGLAILFGLVLAPQHAMAETRIELCGGNYSYTSYDYSGWGTNSSMTVYYWIYNSSNQLIAYGWCRNPGSDRGKGKFQHHIEVYGVLDECGEEFIAQASDSVVAKSFKDEEMFKAQFDDPFIGSDAFDIPADARRLW